MISMMTAKMGTPRMNAAKFRWSWATAHTARREPSTGKLRYAGSRTASCAYAGATAERARTATTVRRPSITAGGSPGRGERTTRPVIIRLPIRIPRRVRTASPDSALVLSVTCDNQAALLCKALDVSREKTVGKFDTLHGEG